MKDKVVNFIVNFGRFSKEMRLFINIPLIISLFLLTWLERLMRNDVIFQLVISFMNLIVFGENQAI